MKSVFKRVLLASMLAGVSLAAFAQGMPPGGPAPVGMHARMHQGDPAKMQERMAKQLAEFKARLKVTPEQEGAWTTFTEALKPPAPMAQKFDWKALEKLSTPERIDKLKELRSQHQAHMDKMADATKTFYAVLNAEQKKTFDAAHWHMMQGRRGPMHGGMQHP